MKTIEDKRTGRKFKPMGSAPSISSALSMICHHFFIDPLTSGINVIECGAYGQKKLYQVSTSTATLDIKIMNRGNRYLIGWEA